MWIEVLALVAAVVGCSTAYRVWRRSQRLRRAEFVRTYRWPRGLLHKLGEKHTGLVRKDAALVSRGLRQFFIAHLMSGNKFVSMPSQIADDLWHEFILYTRDTRNSAVAPLATFFTTHPPLLGSCAASEQRGPSARVVVHLQIREYRPAQSNQITTPVRPRHQAECAERIPIRHRLPTVA